MTRRKDEGGGSFWPRFMVLAVVVLWVSLLGGNWVGRYVMEHNSKFSIKPDEYRPVVTDQRSRLRGRPPVMPELGTPTPEKPAGDQSKDRKPAPAAREKEEKLPPVAEVPVGTENPDQRHPSASRPETVPSPTESRPVDPPRNPDPATAPAPSGGDGGGRPENYSKPAPAAPVPTPERTSQPPAPAPPPPTPAGTGTEG